MRYAYAKCTCLDYVAPRHVLTPECPEFAVVAMASVVTLIERLCAALPMGNNAQRANRRLKRGVKE